MNFTPYHLAKLKNDIVQTCQHKPDDPACYCGFAYRVVNELLARDSRRDERQKNCVQWAVNAFGEAVATNRKERATRVFEEATELAQAEGITENELLFITRRVYEKPQGACRQEVGGLGITLLCYADAIGCSADEEERREYSRIISKPPEYFRERHKIKAALGYAMPIENTTAPLQRCARCGDPVSCPCGAGIGT